MRDVCRLIWLALIGLFRSRASLQAEILTLRHQLNVLRRKSPQRLTFTSIDRLVFAGWSRALWVLGLTSAPALISLVHHFRTTGGRMEASQRKGPDGRRGTRCGH